MRLDSFFSKKTGFAAHAAAWWHIWLQDFDCQLHFGYIMQPVGYKSGYTMEAVQSKFTI